MIVGTAAYMSPEQARGKPVDKRADIWAFGCVLYEMLSGRRPFVGETTTDMLAAIISREPDLTALPAAVPSSVRHLVGAMSREGPEAAVARHRRRESGARGIRSEPGRRRTASPRRAVAGRRGRAAGCGGRVPGVAILPLACGRPVHRIRRSCR